MTHRIIMQWLIFASVRNAAIHVALVRPPMQGSSVCMT